MQAEGRTALSDQSVAPQREGKTALVLATAAAVVLVDQLLKAWVVTSLEGRPPLVILGEWLQLNAVRNSGAAFGVGGSLTIVFTLIAAGVAVVVVRQSRTMTSRLWAVALGGLLGGAIGNLIDRLLRAPGPGRGAVVDFVDVRYFAVFNAADAALTLSALAIVLLSLRGVPMRPSRSS